MVLTAVAWKTALESVFQRFDIGADNSERVVFTNRVKPECETRPSARWKSYTKVRNARRGHQRCSPRVFSSLVVNKNSSLPMVIEPTPSMGSSVGIVSSNRPRPVPLGRANKCRVNKATYGYAMLALQRASSTLTPDDGMPRIRNGSIGSPSDRESDDMESIEEAED